MGQEKCTGRETEVEKERERERERESREKVHATASMVTAVYNCYVRQVMVS